MSVTFTPVLSEASCGGNLAFSVSEMPVSEGGLAGLVMPTAPGDSPIHPVLADNDEANPASPQLADDKEEAEEEVEVTETDSDPDKDDSTPGFGDDLDDGDDDLDEFDDIDEDDFDDDFDDDFEEELDDDYEIEIDDEISAEFGLNTAGEDPSAADDDLDDFEDFSAID